MIPTFSSVRVALLCALLALAACNTISGVGRDIESMGGVIDTSARTTKNKM